MVDHLSPAQRSANMGRIGGKDTKPELIVRKMLHRLGFRFRLHRKDLPGKPDIVLPKYRTVVFVHGCYWHRHKGCRRGCSVPTTCQAFWLDKFEKTEQRDRRTIAALKAAGWNVLTVWECEIKTRKFNVLEMFLSKSITKTRKDT